MRAVVALWSALVLATATLPLATGYRSSWALPVLILMALVPIGLVALGRRMRLPTWAIAVSGTLLCLVPALLILDRAEQVGTGWRSSPAFSLLGPLIDAVPQLLTAPRPAPPDPAFLVPSALVVYLTALVVALVVVGRTTPGAAPLAGAVLLHTAGALLTAGRGDTQGLAVALTAVVLFLGWAWLPATRSAARAATTTADGATSDGVTSPAPSSSSPMAKDEPQSTRSRPQGSTSGGSGRRRLPVVATLTVAVVATFAFSATLVPTERSFEPRALVPPPQLPVPATNPIPDLAAWTARADATLFTMQSTNGAPLPRRMMLTALPDFDGAAWRIDARLRPVGVVEEPDLAPGVGQREVAYALQPGDLRGVWLPTAGRAGTVSTDALMDVHTGVLVLPGGLTEDIVTVETSVDSPSMMALGRAGVPPASTAERYLELPRMPAELGEEALDIVEGLESRWEQALALEAAVRGNRLLDHRAPSGSSYGRIQEFLFADFDDGGQVGSSEQYAAAFAILGRAAGLPTRVVVGFDVGPDAEPAPGEPVAVRGEHARAWAEVYFSRVGWVAFDPSPDVATEVDRPDEIPEGQPDDPDPTPTPTEQQTDVSTEEEAEEAHDAANLVWITTLALVLVVAAVGAVMVSTLLTARRRSRWRRAGATGAWALILRSLEVAGRPAEPGHSAPQVAGTMPEAVRHSAAVVAGAAEHSAYAPAGTDSSATATAPPDGESRGAAPADPWHLAGQVERHLRSSAPWWRRVGWWAWPR